MSSPDTLESRQPVHSDNGHNAFRSVALSTEFLLDRSSSSIAPVGCCKAGSLLEVAQKPPQELMVASPLP